MSVEEMKKDVINKIANIDNDVVLQKVLFFIESIEEKENDKVSLSKNYDAIKDQYGDVLQKLAQFYPPIVCHV